MENSSLFVNHSQLTGHLEKLRDLPPSPPYCPPTGAHATKPVSWYHLCMNTTARWVDRYLLVWFSHLLSLSPSATGPSRRGVFFRPSVLPGTDSFHTLNNQQMGMSGVGIIYTSILHLPCGKLSLRQGGVPCLGPDPSSHKRAVTGVIFFWLPRNSLFC